MSDVASEPLANIDSSTQGQLSVNGELGFESVPGLYSSSLKYFQNNPNLDIDLAGVTHTDSAGVALLIEWLRQARRQNCTIKFHNIPSQLLAIARVCGVAKIL